MSNILIIGRGGLLGTALSRKLTNGKNKECIPNAKLRWSENSIRDDLSSLICEFATSVHQKEWTIHWVAGIGTMGSTIEDLHQEMISFEVFLESLRRSKIPLERGIITYASSAGAMYAGCNDEVISEISVPVPVNPYGKMKMMQETMLTEFAKHNLGVKVVIFRLSNVYGLCQSTKKKQGLLTHMARCILVRKPIHIFVPFDTIRDYIYADDAALKMLTLAEYSFLPKGVTTKIIASEQSVSIAQIIRSFQYVAKVSPRIITSASYLSNQYRHKMKFRSQVFPDSIYTTPLLIGISQLLNAEKRVIQESQVERWKE